MIFDIAADVSDVRVDVDFLEVVVVDVELIYLHKDVLDDAGWASGVDDPKTLDIRLGSRSQGYLARWCVSVDDESCQLMNDEGDDVSIDIDESISIGCGC